MVARINTVAFEGVDVRPIDVQVQITKGLPAFRVVGLPDKAVAESRERVRAALHAMGLSLPAKRITINLAPADVQKEGSHYDLAIALGLLSAMDVLSDHDLISYAALGELSLDGRIRPVAGVLPAAMHAVENDMGLICPADSGGEAAWAGDLEIVAAPTLIQLINHIKGDQVLDPPEPQAKSSSGPIPDLSDVRGQEIAKRALEIAAAGGHNMLMVGPPGSGKSMLAQRLPGILPPMSSREALDVSIIHSISGYLKDGALVDRRPFRDPHHSASLPALVGGGHKATPGEISLAHNGVLFLDELPEFQRNTLESLRQPLESGETLIARANHHVRYPARFQLIAAMNPCRCGYLDDPSRACTQAPRCAAKYQAKISGPLYDRIDLHVDVPAVDARDLAAPKTGEGSDTVRERVITARRTQYKRFRQNGGEKSLAEAGDYTNARLSSDRLENIATPDEAGRNLINQTADQLGLSARGYYRVLRTARTIADLAGAEPVKRPHVAEALSFRRLEPGRLANTG